MPESSCLTTKVRLNTRTSATVGHTRCVSKLPYRDFPVSYHSPIVQVARKIRPCHHRDDVSSYGGGDLHELSYPLSSVTVVTADREGTLSWGVWGVCVDSDDSCSSSGRYSGCGLEDGLRIDSRRNLGDSCSGENSSSCSLRARRKLSPCLGFGVFFLVWRKILE